LSSFFVFLKLLLTSFFKFSAAISDDILAGWIESLGKVHTIIKGYFTSVCFALLLVCSWISCFCVIFRSFPRGLEEGGLLEASPRAAEHQSLVSVLCYFAEIP
jgi:hypothetical protein